MPNMPHAKILFSNDLMKAYLALAIKNGINTPGEGDRLVEISLVNNEFYIPNFSIRGIYVERLGAHIKMQVYFNAYRILRLKNILDTLQDQPITMTLTESGFEINHAVI